MRIRIKDYTFEIGEPFSSGQVISANEAVALNAVRADNIRNAVAGIVAEAMADLPPGGVMDAGRLIEVTRKIAAFDRDYQFPHRHHSSRPMRRWQNFVPVTSRRHSPSWIDVCRSSSRIIKSSSPRAGMSRRETALRASRWSRCCERGPGHDDR